LWVGRADAAFTVVSQRTFITSSVFLVGLAVAVSDPAMAGSKMASDSLGVTVNQTYRYAYGYVAQARNSPNSVEYMYCAVSTFPGSSQGWCALRNAAGLWGNCSTTNANMIDAIEALEGDGYIYVAWDEAGHCTQVSSYVESSAPPKAP
jgi:hypothetical protein